MRPPSSWPGSIRHLPPTHVGWLTKTALESKTGLIPPSVSAHTGILVNRPCSTVAKKFTLVPKVFRSLFKKAAPLTGTPSVRRMKTYSAQSGYVYQYYYEGHRDFRSGGDSGVEFVFTISADLKNWHPVPVLVSADAIRAWESAHGRQLSSTERYAVAKIALFQAFDERPSPAQMKDEVRVRNADIEGIIETLGL